MKHPRWFHPWRIALAFVLRHETTFVVHGKPPPPPKPREVSNVRGGDPNCVGVKGCRPRCISFRIDRTVRDCDTKTGAFNVTSDISPWDVDDFASINCPAAGTCVNDRCGDPLPSDLSIRIVESGYAGSYGTVVNLTDGDEAFTFCSMYPCPKDECPLPEQMGFELLFEMRALESATSPNGSNAEDGLTVFYEDDGSNAEDGLTVFYEEGLTDLTDHFYEDDGIALGLEIYLKAAFVGPAATADGSTRFGPLSIEWMDDPTDCREGLFSFYTPVLPPDNPYIIPLASEPIDDKLFCAGEEYLPPALPVLIPPPSESPTQTVEPTSAPSIPPPRPSQVQALRKFFNSTNMKFSTVHDWFPEGSEEYCVFTGIKCDDDGFVKSIDLNNKGLSGTLPESLSEFSRLQRLAVKRNSIEGTIPTTLSSLMNLVQLEVSYNHLSGSLEVGDMAKIKRLMFQYNHLNGTLPSSICSLNETLLALDVSGNRDLLGELPDCLGDMQLSVLRVDGVGLVGTVPAGLCGIQEMNGLVPNYFGCDAIACSAGKYQPTYGRQTSNATACVECLVPSNVIGGLECHVLDGNDIGSATPSQFPTTTGSPSEQPVLSPSSPPSRPQPSHNPSLAASTPPSNGPSFGPSAIPSKQFSSPPSETPAATPSQIPSASPTSSSITVDAFFTIQLASLTAQMEEENVEVFESISHDFIAESLSQQSTPDYDITLLSVSVLSQYLDDASDDSVALIRGRKSLLRTLRSLEEDGKVLHVEMLATGDVSPRSAPTGVFEDGVLYGFRNNMTTFWSSLEDASSYFAPQSQQIIGPNAAQMGKGSPSRSSKAYIYGFIVAIGAACIVAALFIYRKYSRQQPYRNVLGINESHPQPRSVSESFSITSSEVRD